MVTRKLQGLKGVYGIERDIMASLSMFTMLHDLALVYVSG